MLNIGLDLDGVLGDWESCARAALEAHSGISLHESTSWDYLRDTVPAESWKWLWAERGGRFMIFAQEKPYQGVAVQVARLVNAGHKVHIVTQRPSDTRKVTEDWLAVHNIPYTELTLLSGEKKAEHGPWDYFIDDKIENVLNVQSVCPKTYLQIRQWNRKYPWFLRVRNLEEFVNIVLS